MNGFRADQIRSGVADDRPGRNRNGRIGSDDAIQCGGLKNKGEFDGGIGACADVDPSAVFEFEPSGDELIAWSDGMRQLKL